MCAPRTQIAYERSNTTSSWAIFCLRHVKCACFPDILSGMGVGQTHAGGSAEWAGGVRAGQVGRGGQVARATNAKQRHTSQRTTRCWEREDNGADTLFRKYARKSPKYPDVTRQTVLSAVFSLVLFNNIDNIVE